VDDQGRLFWEGRLTGIIKTGGANVSPVEIDAVIASYPGVKIAQTVGVPHETFGEIVVSCIVAQEDATFDAAEITRFLKERLASFRVPRDAWPRKLSCSLESAINCSRGLAQRNRFNSSGGFIAA
jgi:fatty-acyl-CoA synthase